MSITPFTADHGDNIPAGVSIEIDGRGADFFDNGTFYPWQDGNGMFSKCEATNDLDPFVPRNSVKAAIAAAQEQLGIGFEVGTIGVFVDDDGNVDPLNELK